jgi:hypothetical protein
MIPTDHRGAAGRSASIFDHARVEQFYDQGCRLGWAFTRGPFKDCQRQAYDSLPKDHPLRERVSRERESPAWDVYFFYAPGVRWDDSPPIPTRWVKQSGWDGADSSELWRNDCTAAPIEANLPRELAIQMDELLARR